MADEILWEHVDGPNGGMNTLYPANQIGPREWTSVSNAEIFPGGVKTVCGSVKLGTVFHAVDNPTGTLPLAGTIKFCDTLTFANGDTVLACITTTKFYVLDETPVFPIPKEWLDVTPAVGVPGDPDYGIHAGSTYNYTKAYFKQTSGKEYWIFANGGQVIRYGSDNGVAPRIVSHLPLAPGGYRGGPTYHEARSVCIGWGSLWIAYPLEGAVRGAGGVPFRLRYSAVDDPTDWADMDYVDLQEDAGAIMVAVPLGDMLAVYKDGSIFGVYGTYDPNMPFRKIKRVEGLGAASPTAVIATQIGHFFMPGSLDNIWLYEGMNTAKPCGDKVFRHPANPLLQEWKHRVVTMGSLPSRQVCFGVPVMGGEGSLGPALIYIYNWQDDVWAVRWLPCGALGVRFKLSTDAWVHMWDFDPDLGDEITDTGLDFSDLGETDFCDLHDTVQANVMNELHSMVFTTSNEPCMISKVSMTRADNPQYSGASVTSGQRRPVSSPTAREFVFRGLQLRGEAWNVRLAIWTDKEATITFAYQNFEKRWTWDFRLVGNWLQFKIVTPNTGNGVFWITGYSIGYIPLGVRREGK